MRHILIDDDSLNEHGVLERSSNSSIDLDELEINVLSLEVGNRDDGVDGDLSEFDVGFGDAVDERTKQKYTGEMRSGGDEGGKEGGEGGKIVCGTNILDPNEVIAVLRRLEVSSLENSITSAVRSSSATATAQARSKPSAILMGWIPRSSRDSEAERRAPARTASEKQINSAPVDEVLSVARERGGWQRERAKDSPTTPVVPSPISSS